MHVKCGIHILFVTFLCWKVFSIMQPDGFVEAIGIHQLSSGSYHLMIL